MLANRFRDDLKKAGVGKGRHSFEFTFPGGLTRTESQMVRVQREADGRDIPGSPRMLAAAIDSRGWEEALADVLGGLGCPTDEDHALALLTQQTEAPLSRRADRTGLKAEREVWRLFQRRWGSEPVDMDFAAARALVIDEQIPRAERDAGSIAILSHMRALSALGYAVTFAAFQGMSQTAELKRLAEAEGVTVCGKPHYSCVEDILTRQAGGFDLVYLHRLETAERYLKLARAHMPKARVVYSVADLHNLRLARQAHVEKRPELLSRARGMASGELAVASQADLVITHSRVEAEILQKRLGPHRLRVVPFAAGERKATGPFGDRQGVAFVGGFGHSPNSDAVYWLVREILPRVWSRVPALVCKIAGHGWLPNCLPGLDPRVEIIGPVEDLDALFATVRLTVAPLRFGAGVKGKVLESFAAGLPCVMTEIASEGLPLVGSLIELVGRDAEDLAARILRFHEDEAANRDIGARARALVRDCFRQNCVVESLRAALATGSDVLPLSS